MVANVMKALPCKPCCNLCCETCQCQVPQIEDRNSTNYNPISHHYQAVQQFPIEHQFHQHQQYAPQFQQYSACRPYCY